MTTTKSIFQSKTFWGVLIGLIGLLLAHYNIPAGLPDNADADQIAAYATAIKAANGNFVGIMSVVLSAVGPLLAIYGRIVADTKVTLTGK